jgi:hypothetical protein
MEEVMTEFLWMNEDELRQQCVLLVQALSQSEDCREYLARQVRKAIADGYTRGYTDAVVQNSAALANGNEASNSLH